MNTNDKKVYGYLKADVKVIVNGIVDESPKEEKAEECYQKWFESKSQILHYYNCADAEQILLLEQKKLKASKTWLSEKWCDMEMNTFMKRIRGCLF